jgi:auxin responsive GH3 family protein
MSMTDEEILKKLEDSTKDATCQQLESLRSILEHQSGGGGVRYLQPHLLQHYDATADANTFRQALPLSSYDDYVDHINQMADGLVHHDHPLLSVDPLLCFFYRFTLSSFFSFTLQQQLKYQCLAFSYC